MIAFFGTSIKNIYTVNTNTTHWLHGTLSSQQTRRNLNTKENIRLGKILSVDFLLESLICSSSFVHRQVSDNLFIWKSSKIFKFHLSPQKGDARIVLSHLVFHISRIAINCPMRGNSVRTSQRTVNCTQG